MNNRYKTRDEALENKIKEELKKGNPNLTNILTAVKEFETANLQTIEKLSRDKQSDLKKINGALKQTIQAHGPITMNLLGSAAKRIHGSLLLENNEKAPKLADKWNPFSVRGILIGMGIGALIYYIIDLLCT